MQWLECCTARLYHDGAGQSRAGQRRSSFSPPQGTYMLILYGVYVFVAVDREKGVIRSIHRNAWYGYRVSSSTRRIEWYGTLYCTLHAVAEVSSSISAVALRRSCLGFAADNGIIAPCSYLCSGRHARLCQRCCRDAISIPLYTRDQASHDLSTGILYGALVTSFVATDPLLFAVPRHDII